MTGILNVIALISGGKDSFYSILHCIKNGHNIVALGNLYPSETLIISPNELDSELNSYMYQTVGHTVIPLYEQALGIPLYREVIVGVPLDTELTYGDSELANYADFDRKNESSDETECMVSLLRRIMIEHPSANALCAGAILSTYQRTRIESVACRLGLVPLSYLWQYSKLMCNPSVSLLEEMGHIGLDARIIKVAGSGLDESFLWQTITNKTTIFRMQKYLRRLGLEDDGALIGEGGEFETLVLDGPSYLFKGRIEVRDIDRVIIRDTGGSAWLKIKQAHVVMKSHRQPSKGVAEVPMPELLEPRFRDTFEALNNKDRNENLESLSMSKIMHNYSMESHKLDCKNPQFDPTASMAQWIFSAPPELAMPEAAMNLKEEVTLRLKLAGLKSIDIISAMVLLRSMEDFACMNRIYSTLFLRPNPPVRVTFSCGDSMPTKVNLMMILLVLQPMSSSSSLSAMRSQGKKVLRKALHVQSHSYWAPANIGPYSQAIITTQTNEETIESSTIRVSGQIPLIPNTMQLPTSDISPYPVSFQLTLSLQHLWRIGKVLMVGWWTSIIMYIPHNHLVNDTVPEEAIMASNIWAKLHEFKNGNSIRSVTADASTGELGNESNHELEIESDEPDLWEERYDAARRSHCGATCSTSPGKTHLPDWSLLDNHSDRQQPPLFTIEVHALPRGSRCEWHAQLGIPLSVGPGQIFLHSLISPHYTIYLCIFGLQRQIIIVIPFTRDLSCLLSCLTKAKARLVTASSLPCSWLYDGHSGTFPALSYRDTSLFPTETTLPTPFVPLLIPCYRIWDDAGRRLAHLEIYNTL